MTLSKYAVNARLNSSEKGRFEKVWLREGCRREDAALKDAIVPVNKLAYPFIGFVLMNNEE